MKNKLSRAQALNYALDRYQCVCGGRSYIKSTIESINNARCRDCSSCKICTSNLLQNKVDNVLKEILKELE